MGRAPLKVSLTGPESSGKSTLTLQLASYFGAPFADEYARKFLEHKAGRYDFQDLDEICRGQLEFHSAALLLANDIVLFDTDMIVLYIWSQFRFGRVSPAIESAFMKSDIDLYLLCKPDITWTPDPFRESPLQQERDILFNMYEQMLKLISAKYIVIHGNEDNRMQLAVDAIKRLL